MRAVGLKTHIWNNNLRSTFLLAGFPVLLLGMIYFLQLGLMSAGYLPSTETLAGDFALSLQMMLASAPVALVIAGIWFLIAYFANTGIVALATGAKPVTREEQPGLYNLLENLAISRGMRMPKLNLIDSPALNAFASGVNERQYTITVTTGLLETLTSEEVEAVLAHELTHVINRDVRTMIIASVFAGIISLMCEMVFRSLRFVGGGGRRSKSDGKGAAFLILIAIVVAIIGYVLAIVIRMMISRTREFVADAGSVELTKNPDAMISALRKVSGSAELPAPEQVRGMFLQNHEAGFNALFATHPPIEKRIAALVEFAGGRETSVPIVG